MMIRSQPGYHWIELNSIQFNEWKHFPQFRGRDCILLLNKQEWGGKQSRGTNWLTRGYLIWRRKIQASQWVELVLSNGASQSQLKLGVDRRRRLGAQIVASKDQQASESFLASLQIINCLQLSRRAAPATRQNGGKSRAERTQLQQVGLVNILAS